MPTGGPPDSPLGDLLAELSTELDGLIQKP
jgi:hypothetical protein